MVHVVQFFEGVKLPGGGNDAAVAKGSAGPGVGDGGPNGGKYKQDGNAAVHFMFGLLIFCTFSSERTFGEN